jgi:hypothetical protein
MPKLVSRAEMAQRAGVSPGAITKALRKNGPLVAAAVRDRVDVDHPDAVAYLSRKDRQRTRKRQQEATAAELSDSDETSIATAMAALASDAALEDIEGFNDMTVRQVVDRFGTARAFRDFLDARKRIEDVRKTELDNDEAEGRLISRELVEQHVFGAIEASHMRLLQDLPKSAAIRVNSAFKAGDPVEEIERIIRELISTQLRPVKNTVLRVMKTA